MSVRVTIIEGPIGADTRPGGPAPASVAAGAVLTFEGIVRPDEDGRAIAALDYHVYDPMATRQMESIARALVDELALDSIAVLHSRGRVGVGECSLRVEIASRHRAPALAAMARFIDLLKRDVPIWKSAVWSRGLPG